MTNSKTLKTQTKRLQAERAELIQRIPQVQAEVAALEARVKAGHREGGRAGGHLPNADNEAREALPSALAELESLEGQLADVEKLLEKLRLQAESERTIAALQAQVATIDADIAARVAAVDSDKAKAAKYGAERDASLAAADAANRRAGLALADGKPMPALDEALAHVQEANAKGHAVTVLNDRIAAAEAEMAPLRERRATVQGELDVTNLHAADAAMADAWAELLPALLRLRTAQRRAYGYSAVEMPDLKHEYRLWLDAQGVED